MSATLITFEKQLEFGFAHHTYWNNPYQIQTELQHSFVILYVKSGELKAKIYDKVFAAPTGSLLILFRHFPFELYTEDGAAQDYCSIKVYTDYTFSLMEDNEDFPKNFTGLALPVVVPPGAETESIKRDIFSIISHLSISRDTYGFYASMTMCGILSKLDMFYRQKLHKGKTASSYWEYKIKRYLAENISRQVSLEELSKALGKTPNYLNNVFTEANGTSIHQYINYEKMHHVATLMEMRGLSFGVACENVGITDVSHGYRLFKKHMGVTPKAYIDSERFTFENQP